MLVPLRFRRSSRRTPPRFCRCSPSPTPCGRGPLPFQKKLPRLGICRTALRTASPIPAGPAGSSRSWTAPPSPECPGIPASPSPPANGRSWYFRWPNRIPFPEEVRSPVRCTGRHIESSRTAPSWRFSSRAIRLPGFPCTLRRSSRQPGGWDPWPPWTPRRCSAAAATAP